MEITSPACKRLRKAITLLLLASPLTPALACTRTQGGDNVMIQVNVPLEKVNAPYGEILAYWSSAFGSADRHFVDGCDDHQRVSFKALMQNHGFRRYGTLVVDGYTYTTFELTYFPNTPLFIFRHTAGTRTGGVGGFMQPVWDLSNIENPGLIPPAGGMEGRDSIFHVTLVARGTPMRGFGPMTLGTFVSWPRYYPSLIVNSGLSMAINIPRATCTLNDQNVPLPDVSASELRDASSTARETPFDITMNCSNTDTVRLTIRDALSPSSIDSTLTPSSDTTAQHVRLQIGRRDLGSRVPLAMNSNWTIGVKQGPTLIPFFARYYRTNPPGVIAPGKIGAEATLTVTYL